MFPYLNILDYQVTGCKYPSVIIHQFLLRDNVLLCSLKYIYKFRSLTHLSDLWPVWNVLNTRTSAHTKRRCVCETPSSGVTGSKFEASKVVNVCTLLEGDSYQPLGSTLYSTESEKTTRLKFPNKRADRHSSFWSRTCDHQISYLSDCKGSLNVRNVLLINRLPGFKKNHSTS